MKYNDLIVCTYEDPLFNVSFDYYEVEPVNKAIEELNELLHEYRIDIQNLKNRIEELT